ncbi:bifunctional acetate--CoA ligase family protein/GNAT family N-acetyltransferase [Roseateles microcysteis]|uniref:bifunctional acetate--CoA ligase family protein/GNAT family N-acetyltransferase n=1 Tax=Roseateles microcysteis TaxID=3119057 RepID=UPI002FE58763
MSIRNLDKLLNPASVAVAGASDRPGSVGTTVWQQLLGAGFAGPVYAINRHHEQLNGQPVYARAEDLPSAPDLAVICTPPDSVAGLITEFGRRGTRAAIVMTAGLTSAQRSAMLEAARPWLLRVLGPNCLGLMSPHLRLNASFAHTDALAGEIAFISQSGALVTAMLDWAKSREIGFSHLVSLGEHADVDFGDLLDHLASDAGTRAILLYIESIEAPRKFISAARAAARNKPVIVVKAGRAGHGVQAAASHTRAMAASDVVFDAAIRRAGMLRVDRLQELFTAAATLAHLRDSAGSVLTIMTNGGGAGVLAADAAALAKVPMHGLDDAMLARLDAKLPATWSRANPIDIIGDAPIQRYVDTLQALIDDPDSGTILFMHAPTAIVRSEDIATACAPLAGAARHRMMACWLGGDSVIRARETFNAAGLADYETPEEAVQACAMLASYRHNQALLEQVPSASEGPPPRLADARRVIDRALAEGREMLDETEAKAVLQAYGVPVVETRAVGLEAAEVLAAAAAIGYPLALKLRSPDIVHKSDCGAVALDLADEASLLRARLAMLAQVSGAMPAARLTGFSVQSMASRPHASELIIGASVDPMFGPIVLFGEGGTAVEVLADRAIGLPPLNRVLAGDMVARTRVARRLAGYRDHAPARLDAISDVLIAVGQMAADLPELAELDINPLWADEEGVLALDARIRLDARGPAGMAHFAILPYPAKLAETVDWRGEALLLRPIRPEDGPAHKAFVCKLEVEDLRLRFFSSRRELPASQQARLVQIDYAREMAFIAMRSEVDGSSTVLGVVRAVTDPDNEAAEFAIIVRSDLKGLGLGRILMDKLLRFLAAQGTRKLECDVLRENEPMLRLARHLGMEQVASLSGGGALHFRKLLHP